MATHMRATISSWSSTDPKLDKVTQTVYFERETAPIPADYQAIATDLLAAWNVGSVTYGKGADRQSVKVYNLEDAVPRLPRAEATSQVNTGVAGAREVACCLSFRGAENRPRQRGRIYMGPFAAADMHARPQTALTDAIHAFADRLAGIGGTDVDWCVFSPTSRAAGASLGDSFHPVQHSWVDDSWDTQRSRGLPPATRKTKTHSE